MPPTCQRTTPSPTVYRQYDDDIQDIGPDNGILAAGKCIADKDHGENAIQRMGLPMPTAERILPAARI